MATFVEKLNANTLAEIDWAMIYWQCDHMDAVDEQGNYREPTHMDAAGVLDALEIEAEKESC